MSGRAATFSLVAVPIYIAGYYAGLPLFYYYPQVQRISFTPLAGAGFAIMWYGWIASAIIAGLAAAFAVPRRWSDRLPIDLTWIVLLGALMAILLYERRWFF
jgi:hypothetical protein